MSSRRKKEQAATDRYDAEVLRRADPGGKIRAMGPSPFAPPASLLVKLGSIAVHVTELVAPGGHEFDLETLRGLLTDPEVEEWLKEMDALALLPVKR